MTKIILFLLCFGAIPVLAEEVPAKVLPEIEKDHPTAHLDEDDINFKYDAFNFNMKMRFRVQGRATYTNNDEDNLTSPDKMGFEIRRTRISLDGGVLDPHLFYKVQLAFSRGDMDWDTNAYPNILRDAVMGWKFNDHYAVFFGQTKLPGNRQRMVSSGKQELVDRSLLNSTFTIDRDVGLQSWNRFGDSRPVWLKLAISNGEGRASDNGDMGLATTARVEWLPLGVFKKDGDFSEGDVEFEPSPKLSLATAYSVNKRTHRVGGQIGKYIASGDSRDLKTFFGDLLFKYQGWAFESEYARRQADNPIIDASHFILVGDSVNAQLSYVFPNMYSPVVRWTKLWPEENIYARADIRTQYTAGLTKYFNKHKVKLQADVTYETLDKPVLKEEQQNWIARLQFELGI